MHKKKRMPYLEIVRQNRSWLIKAEGAFFTGLEFFIVPGETREKYELLGGIEYSGFTEAVVSVEIVKRHIVDFEDANESDPDAAQEDEYQTYLRYTQDFLSARLHATILVSFFEIDGSGGGFGRYQLKYDIMDALSLTGGIVDYQSGDVAFLHNIRDNDRAFLDIKYSF